MNIPLKIYHFIFIKKLYKFKITQPAISWECFSPQLLTKYSVDYESACIFSLMACIYRSGSFYNQQL